MSLFTINADTCQCCGLCAAECPAGCVLFEEDQIPVPHEKKYAYCIGCGHCMAVCPAGSFQLERFENPAIPKLKDLAVSPEQVTQFLAGRRSVRAFRNDLVGQDMLQQLVDLTEYAPSGHNARPVRWTVAATPDKVHEVAGQVAEWMRSEVERETETARMLHLEGIVRLWDDGTDLICRNAPALAVAYGPEKGVTPFHDGVLAVSYLELAAAGHGLGACWCGYLNAAANRDEAVRQALGVSAGNQVFGSLMLGRPARKNSAIPPRDGAGINWL